MRNNSYLKLFIIVLFLTRLDAFGQYNGYYGYCAIDSTQRVKQKLREHKIFNYENSRYLRGYKYKLVAFDTDSTFRYIDLENKTQTSLINLKHQVKNDNDLWIVFNKRSIQLLISYMYNDSLINKSYMYSLPLDSLIDMSAFNEKVQKKIYRNKNWR